MRRQMHSGKNVVRQKYVLTVMYLLTLVAFKSAELNGWDIKLFKDYKRVNYEDYNRAASLL
jgi:hypothetical protein